MKKQNLLKLVVATACCCTLSLCYAGDGSHNVSLELYTANATLSDPLQVGEKLSLQKTLSKHTYVTASLSSAGKGAYTAETDWGLTTTYKRFSPFVEAEVAYSQEHKHGSVAFDYDFGTTYKLTDHVLPLVVFDSVGLNNNDLVEVGSVFLLPQHWSLTVTASKYLHHAGNGAQVKLGYSF